jgi:hypothetical protein
VFDRYNIVNEQELLTAGQRLAAYLAQASRTEPDPLGDPWSGRPRINPGPLGGTPMPPQSRRSE